MASYYQGTRDIKKEHYQMGILLTEEKKKEILRENFLRRVGYELNLDEPRSFNEKIMWMKLYYQNPLITKCCDKYAVKDYVADVIGSQYAVPNIGRWEDPDDIDFDALPDRFVLKVNWSSGYNIICSDKSKLDIAKTRQMLKKWTKPDRNAYYQFFNWGFKHMKPVIYAEEYLEQVDEQVYDYKFFVMNGKVRMMFIATDRKGINQLTHDFFDRDFNLLPFTYGGIRYANPLPEKPQNYDKMVELAEKLAAPFPFCRVDFYETGPQIYLGEMTFYPGGGILPFDPVSWDYEIGSWLELPEKMITDKPGPMLPLRIAVVKGWRTVRTSMSSLRRKIIRHDVIRKKHFVTLFGVLRFRFEKHVERGSKYFTLSGIQLRYKKGEPVVRDPNKPSVPMPEFTPLLPREAFAMEDKITLQMKKHYCEQKAYAQLRYFPNLDNPQSWNEKLLWLALYYKNPVHALASNKALAKDWIADRIGSEYVVPLIGAYDNVNDIDFASLPDNFVMKANEGWGANEVILVTGKDRYDVDRLKAVAAAWLYPWSSYYYNNMCITDEKPEKPLIVIEEYLGDMEHKYLNDYKFYCCNGEVKFALVVTDRGDKNQKRTFVDADWNLLPVRRAGKFTAEVPEKPENLDLMFELARKLSKDIPLVRIDFYNLDGKIYVGEMTFTPGMFLRFEPKEMDFKLGEYLDLTDLMKQLQPGDQN